MSRKQVKIDWDYVGKQLQKGCSGTSIASSLGIHENTLYSRCKSDLSMEFVAFSQQKRAEGNDLIHAKQFDVGVIDGNVPMLIWLGKQRLGQSDKTENKSEITEIIVREIDAGIS